MRRFSQRSALVTLSEINITPLLDLAFVLLIIFVITTPLIEKSLPLRLPKVEGGPNPRVDAHDIRTVEIGALGLGELRLNGKPMLLGPLIQKLADDFQSNTNLVVAIRADENGRNKDTYAVIDALRKQGLTRMDLKTEPPRHP